MRKLTEAEAGLLEQILEAGIKAVTGEEVPITINLPETEPKYEYVTDGKPRKLRQGDWYCDTYNKTFLQYQAHGTDGTYLAYRRVEKKP